MSAQGYSLKPSSRSAARAECFIQSIIPWPLGPEDPQDLVDVRLGPNETREFNLNFDPTAVFEQVFFRFQVKNEYASPDLTGVLSFAATDTKVYTGVGTAFLAELLPGDVVGYVNDSDEFVEVTVRAVTADDTFIGSKRITVAATDKTFVKMIPRNIPADWSTGLRGDWAAGTITNAGTITVNPANNTLVGVGTLFTTQLVVGDKIQVYANDGTQMHLIIESIADDTNATLRGFPPLAATAKAYSRFYTRYSDLEFQIFDSAGRSFGPPINLEANQGAFGSADLLHGMDAILHREYWLGRREAIILKVKNRASDARRVHGHVYTVRVLT